MWRISVISIDFVRILMHFKALLTGTDSFGGGVKPRTLLKYAHGTILAYDFKVNTFI